MSALLVVLAALVTAVAATNHQQHALLAAATSHPALRTGDDILSFEAVWNARRWAALADVDGRTSSPEWEKVSHCFPYCAMDASGRQMLEGHDLWARVANTTAREGRGAVVVFLGEGRIGRATPCTQKKKGQCAPWAYAKFHSCPKLCDLLDHDARAQMKRPYVIVGGFDVNDGLFSECVRDRTEHRLGPLRSHLACCGRTLEDVATFLDDPNLLLVLTNQHVAAYHPKIVSVPLGYPSRWRARGAWEAATAAAAAPANRSRTVLANFWPHNVGRKAILKDANATLNGTISTSFERKKSPIPDYLSSTFVLAPAGVGWDTYRMFEAMVNGAIPIVERMPGNDHTLHNLPVVLVASMTRPPPEDKLRRIAGEYAAKAAAFSWEKLGWKWWHSLVERVAADPVGAGAVLASTFPCVGKGCTAGGAWASGSAAGGVPRGAKGPRSGEDCQATPGAS